MGEMPPGFRFFPTEEELLSFYLHKNLEGKGQKFHRLIPTVDIYELEPWQLPKMSGELCRGDTEQWFFFTPRPEREAQGGRPRRTAGSGYWKATGSPSYVYSSDDRVIGVKKAMVFYKGKAPTGRKTKWKMNEYKAIQQEPNSSPLGSSVPKLRHEMRLCRVYVISGCFRAFDRRPLWAETGEPRSSGSGAAHQVDGHRATASIQAAAEKTSSPESSHSEGGGGGGGGGGDQLELPQNKLGVVNDEEPLWEWEQLNWL